MAKKWSEVIQSPEYQALPDQEKEAARNQYFEQVVTPQLTDPNELTAARSQFDQMYGPKKPAKADFSGSSGGVQSNAPISKPVLAPSALPSPKGIASLAEINAKNAAYKASPQRAADEAQYSNASADWKKKEFQALPAPARAFIGAGSRVGSAGRGFAQLAAYGQDLVSPSGNYDRAMQEEAAARNRDQYMEGDTAATMGKFAGDVALTAVPLSKAGAATKIGQYGGAALTGAAYSGLQPVIAGESRTKNTAIGGAFGLAGQGVSNALLKSGAKAAQAQIPESKKVYDYAKSIGINLTPGQLADNAYMKRFTSMMDKMPFSGATARNEKQQLAGNKKLLELIGQKGDGMLTPERFAKAGDDLGQRFDKVFQNGTAYDTPFLRDLAKLRKETLGQMDDTAVRTVNTFVERVKKQAGTGFIPPKTLQSLDQMARKAATGGGDRQQVAQELRNILHDNFTRNANSAVKNEWKGLRKQYADFKTLEPVVARNPENGVPLQALKGAINSNQRGRGLMARDKAGEIGKLAKVGQRMVAPSSSGTVENGLAAGTGAGLLTNAPVTLSGLLGGSILSRVANGETAGRLLRNANPGSTRKALAPLGRAAGILLAPPVNEKKKPAKK